MGPGLRYGVVRKNQKRGCATRQASAQVLSGSFAVIAAACSALAHPSRSLQQFSFAMQFDLFADNSPCRANEPTSPAVLPPSPLAAEQRTEVDAMMSKLALNDEHASSEVTPASVLAAREKKLARELRAMQEFLPGPSSSAPPCTPGRAKRSTEAGPSTRPARTPGGRTHHENDKEQTDEPAAHDMDQLLCSRCGRSNFSALAGLKSHERCDYCPVLQRTIDDGP